MSKTIILIQRIPARRFCTILATSSRYSLHQGHRVFLLYLGLIALLFIHASFPAAYSQQKTLSADIPKGHFSREGNNDRPAQTINNNIYIKLFMDNSIATLYVPYPYAESVPPEIIAKVLEQAKHQTAGSAFIRGKFGHLEQDATVHVERFGFVEDKIVYECGSLAPCTIELHEGYLELIKPGVINEHIIKYHHVKVDG